MAPLGNKVRKQNYLLSKTKNQAEIAWFFVFLISRCWPSNVLAFGESQ